MMDWSTVLIFYLVFCGLVAIIARMRGHPAGQYLVMAMILSPLIAFLIAMIAKPHKPATPVA